MRRDDWCFLSSITQSLNYVQFIFCIPNNNGMGFPSFFFEAMVLVLENPKRGPQQMNLSLKGQMRTDMSDGSRE